MDSPCVLRALSGLRSGLDGDAGDEDEDAKQILAAMEDHVYVWSRKDFAVVAIALGEGVNTEEEDRVQVFTLTDTPLFEVEHLVPSISGRRICIYGRKGVMVVELPRYKAIPMCK